MKAIVVLVDSLRRDCLSFYEDSDIETPNLERFKNKSTIFDQHWAGSLPCMPARRDMFTGRLNFLERNWGPIEPFDETLPNILKQNGIFSHIITDHYHYFEKGGENYCQNFNSWELIRGQEKDVWESRVHPPTTPKHIGQYNVQYLLNKKNFKSEEDFPSPKTFQSAVNWLEKNKDADNYLLWVEAFDPHEPFDLPDQYLKDAYSGPIYFWPEYDKVSETSDESFDHIKYRYKRLVEMTDKWIGFLFDKMDELNMWEDTMVIFTTDHGYMFGEHNFMGKNYMPMYNEISHLPLMVYLPCNEEYPSRIDGLTQNTDILPTILDFFGLNDTTPKQVQGKSWLSLLKNEKTKLRDYCLFGVYGKNVNITDGNFTYFRASANKQNSPLNIYTATPTTLLEDYNSHNIENMNLIQMGWFLEWAEYPVYKIPAEHINIADESLGFKTTSRYVSENLLFNLNDDYKQKTPIKIDQQEKKYIKLLKLALEEVGSPEDQFIRLGLR